MLKKRLGGEQIVTETALAWTEKCRRPWPIS